MRSFQSTFGVAIRALARHKVRSALTCVGIVIGVAAVVAMEEIGAGTAYAMQQAVASVGANVVNVDPSDTVKAGISSGSGGRVTLVPADAAAIKTECGAVRWSVPSVDCRAELVYGDRSWFVHQIKGTTPDYLRVRNWSHLARGRMFTDQDVTRCAPVCVIGQTVLRELFRGVSPVGKEIRIRNAMMKVLGVLTAKGANMMGRDQDDFVIAPWTTVKYRLNGAREAAVPPAATGASTAPNSLQQAYPSQGLVLYPTPSPTQAADELMMTRFTDIDDIYISVNSSEEVPQVDRQIRSLLRRRHDLAEGEPDDFRIRNLTEISETMASTGRQMTSLLLWVALIALVVGGVGIMNIMLTSVKERTREIGVRMAVGARGRDVLAQFLAEALVLSFVGGIGGVVAGHSASIVVTKVLGWPTTTSLSAIATAFAVCGLTGVLFGFYPAWTAARSDPIQALRYE